MANQFSVAPVNINPGLQGLNEGIQSGQEQEIAQQKFQEHFYHYLSPIYFQILLV